MNRSADEGAADESSDATEDVPPIICRHCNDTPGADASDGGEEAADDAAERVDATVDNHTSDATAPDAESGSAQGGESTLEAGDMDGPSVEASGTGSCGSGELSCDGGCVSSDVHHCGACDNDCTNLPYVSGAVACASGRCSFPASSCAPNRADCNGNPTDGCETDLTQTSHCGDCTTACGAGAPVCATVDGGENCASGCPAATPTLCSGTCVDTSNSIANCGACGAPCTTSIAHAQPACSISTCTFLCNSGYTECNGACVDELTDPSNCGGCGASHVCAGGTTCQNGSCKCPAGTHDCGGTCESNASLNSCGAACNVACPGPSNGSSAGVATCNGTSCGITCSQGYTLCGSACVDEQSDSDHCGACGTVCGAGTTCVSGACVCNTVSCPNGCCSGNQCAMKPTWYQDADGDGYGNASVPMAACAKPSGYVADSSDCCDADGNAHPGSTYCASSKRACGDNWDYNCDGASDAVTCSADPGTVTNAPMDCQNQGETITCGFDSSNNCVGTCSGSSSPNAACASACDWQVSSPCGTATGYDHILCAVAGPSCVDATADNGFGMQTCN